MVLAAMDESVCQTIEKVPQPIFASMHTFVWLHLEHPDVLYSPPFSIFAPTTDNLVGTGFKSRFTIRIGRQKAHPLYNLQVNARVAPRTSCF
jgi:hypothetical protein